MPSPKPGLLSRVVEIVTVCAQARAAAHQYEHLHAMSDRALAELGLKRTELTRAAFDKLCEKPQGLSTAHEGQRALPSAMRIA
jgi:uncharacterized protein YjiS (DUF1127 family)